MAYMDEKFTATHPNGGTMRIVRKNILDKETDPFLLVTVYFPKTSPGPRRVSTKLKFHEGEDGTREDYEAWTYYMEELGWKFPKKLLDPLGGYTRVQPAGRHGITLSWWSLATSHKPNGRTHMAFGDSYSEAKHNDGRVMKLTRSNSNGLTRMRAVVFSQKRPGNIRRKLLSEHNFFEPDEFSAWLAHMEELGWKFPRNILDPLGSHGRGRMGRVCTLPMCRWKDRETQ